MPTAGPESSRRPAPSTSPTSAPAAPCCRCCCSRRRARACAFTPLNYRLSDDGLRQLIDRLPTPLVIADAEYRDVVAGAGKQVISSDEFIAAARTAEPAAEFADPDDVAVVLFTSGTTSRPKAVELTHNNLTSYVTGTVEFDSAEPGDAALICVPPYHIAGVSAALSNLYAGRKMVYLTKFDADRVGPAGRRRGRHVPRPWCRPCSTASSRCWRPQPARAADAAQPRLRRLEGRAPVGAQGAWTAARRRLRQRLRPHRDQFDDRGAHPRRPPRRARPRPTMRSPGGSVRSVSRCPASRCRSAPRTAPSSGPGETGELFVRGEQVSGRYTDIGSVLDAEGWFPTKDVAMLDEGGYLFIGGRSDDTIIRGGENIAPAEIEDVLVEHPACARLRGRRARGSRVGPDHRRGRGARRRRQPRPRRTARACPSAACADPVRPTAWYSVTSCPPTRPARCCAASWSTN